MRPLRVLSAGAAQGLIGALERRGTGPRCSEVTADFAPVGVLSERLRAGEPCDVLITSRRQVEALLGEGRMIARSVRVLGSVRTGIAVRVADPAPTVADIAALTDTVRHASHVHLGDTHRSTAGRHLAGMFARCGLAADIASALVIHDNGKQAMRALACDVTPAPLGFAQETEVRADAGVRWCAPLPVPFGLSTEYVVGVTTSATIPDLAGGYVEALTSGSTVPMRRRAGFQVDEPAPG